MVKLKCTAEDLRWINYFWQQKGDHTRYVNWEAIEDDFKQRFPEVIDAVKHLEGAERAVGRAMKTLDDEAIKMEDASDQ